MKLRREQSTQVNVDQDADVNRRTQKRSYPGHPDHPDAVEHEVGGKEGLGGDSEDHQAGAVSGQAKTIAEPSTGGRRRKGGAKRRKAAADKSTRPQESSNEHQPPPLAAADRKHVVVGHPAGESTGVADQLEEISALGRELVSLKALAVRTQGLFEWVDGPLVTAMRKGELILLDELSLAEDAVLERLNSVLEPGRSITLAEKGGAGAVGSQGAAETVVAAPGFRCVGLVFPREHSRLVYPGTFKVGVTSGEIFTDLSRYSRCILDIVMVLVVCGCVNRS